nr:hypothetical protein [uncultured Porphyromonas sp.]
MKDAKRAKEEKPEKKANPLYRPSARRRDRVDDEVIRWIVDIALDPECDTTVSGLCIEAVRHFSLTYSANSLQVYLRTAPYYRDNMEQIRANQLELRRERSRQFHNSDVIIFWPLWKLRERGYLVRG